MEDATEGKPVAPGVQERPAAPTPGAPIRIELHAERGGQRQLGEPWVVSVRVVNVSDEPVWMVGVVPGSDGLRYPQYLVEILGPEGPIHPRFPEALDYVRGLRTADFVRLAPGEGFDPESEPFIAIQPLAWFVPSQPGTYRLRLCFDATAHDPHLWLGDTYVPEREKVEKLIQRVPSVLVWSNALLIEYRS